MMRMGFISKSVFSCMTVTLLLMFLCCKNNAPGDMDTFGETIELKGSDKVYVMECKVVNKQLDSLVNLVVNYCDTVKSRKPGHILLLELRTDSTRQSIFSFSLQDAHEAIAINVVSGNARFLGCIHKRKETIYVISKMKSVLDISNAFSKYILPTDRKGKLNIPVQLFFENVYYSENCKNEWSDGYIYDPLKLSYWFKNGALTKKMLHL